MYSRINIPLDVILVAEPLGLEFSWKICLHETFKGDVIIIVSRVIIALKLFAQLSPGNILQWCYWCCSVLKVQCNYVRNYYHVDSELPGV